MGIQLDHGASLYKRKGSPDWYLGLNYPGQRRWRKSLHTTNKDRALRIARDLVSKALSTTWDVPILRDITLEESIKEYKKHAPLRNAPRTVELNLSVLEGFQTYLKDSQGNPKSPIVSRIGPVAIEGYLRRRKEEGRSNDTLNRARGALSTFFTFARRQGTARANPVDQVAPFPVVHNRIPRILSANEIERLLAEAANPIPCHGRGQKGQGNSRPRLTPLYDMIFYALNTGARLEEMLYTEWRDIDFELGVVLFACKPEHMVKGYKERVVGANDALLEMLRRRKLSAGQFRWVFANARGGVIDGGNAYRELKIIAKRANVPHANFRIMRTTFLTMCARAAGTPFVVKDLAGHASVRTTERHYIGQVGASEWKPPVIGSTMK
jgi:integrase/recombinase XerC